MKTLSFQLLFISLLFFSCVPEGEEDGEFDVPLKWSSIQGSANWDVSLRKALEEHGEELMDSEPADVERFSSKYKRMNYNERLNFWAYLISIMAEKESSFKPETAFVESFTDQNGERVVSRGLLQISIESARGYQCPLANAQDLHDPELNLICAVRIMKRWVINDGVISGGGSGAWRGGARYWSVLRRESTLDFFTTNTRANF